MPKARPIPKQKKADQNFDDLKHLFDTDSDSDSEFFGFDCSSRKNQDQNLAELRHIFNTESDSDNEFFGFEYPFNRCSNNLKKNIFESDTDDEEFLGF